MLLFFQYLLKLSLSLGVVYIFYFFLLRRWTFYNTNRWYLLLYSFCSFLIPLVNVYPVLQKSKLEVSGIVNYIPAVSSRIAINDPVISQKIAYEDAQLAGQWALIILVIGIAVMLFRLLVQYISFLRVKRASTLILCDPIKVFQVNDPIIPFSIGNSIFINHHLHNEEELKEIIRHEFIHVKQRHSIDIFLSEVLCVLNWYNPFAWLIRRAIKVNLEFIADNKVLEGGLDKKEYQYLLLKVIGVPQFSISTQFNFSSLKKRIAMMNKKQSAKAQLLKLLLLLPVIVIVLLAFRSAGKNIPWNFSQNSTYVQDTIPGPPPPPKEFDDFLKRNSSVKSVGIKNNILTIDLKAGGKETYNLSKGSDVEAAEKKYGPLTLVPPPPPPPPKPALPKDVKSISITETKAVVVLANGKKEEFDLTKMEELEAFQDKYQSVNVPGSFDDMNHELQLMELKARQEEISNLRREKENAFKLMQRDFEEEMRREHERKEEAVRHLSKEKQRELDLLHKQFELEVEKEDELLRREFEKAANVKGADKEKLMKKLEMEKEHRKGRKEIELLRAEREKEMEMEMLQREIELDSRMELHQRNEQMREKEQELLSHLNELHERNAMLQNRLNIDAKNLSPEQKKEVISQLEVQKKELNKMMQDLKSKEIQINKQLQDLKKSGQ